VLFEDDDILGDGTVIFLWRNMIAPLFFLARYLAREPATAKSSENDWSGDHSDDDVDHAILQTRTPPSSLRVTYSRPLIDPIRHASALMLSAVAPGRNMSVPRRICLILAE
jgi:hypothetical protein